MMALNLKVHCACLYARLCLLQRLKQPSKPLANLVATVSEGLWGTPTEQLLAHTA